MDILDIKNKIVEEIRTTVEEYKTEKLIVAFSGGMDSSASAILCTEALGHEKVELVHVVYGPYTYSKSLEIVSNFSEKYNLKVSFVYNRGQEKIWKYGPACNMCTKEIKMGTVKRYAGNNLIVTGSNSSDTWGQTGLKVFEGMYAPLSEYNKDTIKKILDLYDFKLERIGEHALREGCKLKHLMKPMAKPSYHGKAVSIANEIVLDFFPAGNQLANVKIIGPLSKNIAIVNVLPFREEAYKLAEVLKSLDVINEVVVADKPLVLKIIANPSIYRVEMSKYWIENGKLRPEFAVPIKVEWLESKNNKLRTFHIVEVREWTNYEEEKDIVLKNYKNVSATDLETMCFCSMPSATHHTPMK